MIITTLRSSVTAARLPENSASRESAARIRTFRVLIVNDHCPLARGLARQLQQRGHRVRCAYTGVAALKLAHVFQPEFALVDAALPDLSGYEIAALLPGVIDSTRLCVASISAEGHAEDESLSQAAGCVSHLCQPVALAEIEALLGTLPRQSGFRGGIHETPAKNGQEKTKLLLPAGTKNGAILTPEKRPLPLPAGNMSPSPGNPRFPTTRWTRVLHLRGTDDQALRQEALAHLCRDYWFPLYAFARRQGRSQEDAEDLTQGFFAYALAHEVFSLADRDAGTLRTFLLRVFQRYMGGVRDRETAQKRGGGREILPLNFDDGEELYTRELATQDSPELLFDRTWAQALLRATLATLAAEENTAGRGPQFELLEPFLTPSGVAEQSYEAVVRELGLTADAVRQAVSRLRKKFRACLRDQIAGTLQDPDDARIDAELQALKIALSR